MNKKEEKKIYKIIAQKEGITITAETHETTLEEVTETAIEEVLGGVDKAVDFRPFVALPVTTKERWDAGYINYCPRCGANISEYDLGEYANTDCYECNASLDINVSVYNHSEED